MQNMNCDLDLPLKLTPRSCPDCNMFSILLSDYQWYFSHGQVSMGFISKLIYIRTIQLAQQGPSQKKPTTTKKTQLTHCIRKTTLN